MFFVAHGSIWSINFFRRGTGSVPENAIRGLQLSVSLQTQQSFVSGMGGCVHVNLSFGQIKISKMYCGKDLVC